MESLYAFLRLTDDLADEPGETAVKRASLAAWRAGLAAALRGRFTHPVHAALADTAGRYAIPRQFLDDVIDGVESDLEPQPFASFAALYPYCYRVAAAVGLACVRIWGVREGSTFERAAAAAEAAGIAFQLTNILRDLGEDRARGRIYLPADEIARFACPPEAWTDPARADRFARLLRYQAARAREYYDRARALVLLLSTEGRAIFHVMYGTYRRLLDEVERSGAGLFERRVGVPVWRKALVLAGGWGTLWGWM
jgi:phytoene synthase